MCYYDNVIKHRETGAFSYAGIAQRESNCLVSSGLVGSNPLAGSKRFWHRETGAF